MYLKTTQVSFRNQVFSVGIDTHKKSWNITIRCNFLQLKRFSMNPSPKELSVYMHRNYPGGTYRSVYEAGFCGYWIHRELAQLGFSNIICNAADVPTSNKEKDRKSDPIDSAKLSRELENSSLSGIYVITPQQESLRSLSRLVRQYSQRSTQIKNRIKSLLNFVGCSMPEGYETAHWSMNYIKILKNLTFKEDINRLVLDDHLDELEHNRAKKLLLLRKVRKICRETPTIKLLRTIPGVGLITSFILYVEIVDMKRFNGLDELCAFIGLVPSTSSSGAKEHTNGITKRHNRFLRNILIESAWVAARMDPAMTAAFNNLTRRLSRQRAIVRIAKKLTNRIRWVWLHQKTYITAVVE